MKAGIDAGGSLIKIAYEEKEKIHYKKYHINELDQAISWLKMVAPVIKVGLTGGKAQLIQKKYFPDGEIVPEFQATCKGARMFLLKEEKNIEEPFLLVNIGTGTSWHIVQGKKFERILGSGVGGGIFTGLGSLLTSEADFGKLTELAKKGDKGKVDLLVKDIYESDDPPIDGNLTAANFAKGAKVKQSEADRMAAVTNMITETIVLLTMQAAAIHQVKEVIFIGSTLIGNDSLKKGLEYYMNMMKLSATFLKNGEYCGATGAYLTV